MKVEKRFFCIVSDENSGNLQLKVVLRHRGRNGKVGLEVKSKVLHNVKRADKARYIMMLRKQYHNLGIEDEST